MSSSSIVCSNIVDDKTMTKLCNEIHDKTTENTNLKAKLTKSYDSLTNIQNRINESIKQFETLRERNHQLQTSLKLKQNIETKQNQTLTNLQIKIIQLKNLTESLQLTYKESTQMITYLNENKKTLEKDIRSLKIKVSTSQKVIETCRINEKELVLKNDFLHTNIQKLTKNEIALNKQILSLNNTILFNKKHNENILNSLNLDISDLSFTKSLHSYHIQILYSILRNTTAKCNYSVCNITSHQLSNDTCQSSAPLFSFTSMEKSVANIVRNYENELKSNIKADELKPNSSFKYVSNHVNSNATFIVCSSIDFLCPLKYQLSHFNLTQIQNDIANNYANHNSTYYIFNIGIIIISFIIMLLFAITRCMNPIQYTSKQQKRYQRNVLTSATNLENLSTKSKETNHNRPIDTKKLSHIQTTYTSSISNMEEPLNTTTSSITPTSQLLPTVTINSDIFDSQCNTSRARNDDDGSDASTPRCTPFQRSFYIPNTNRHISVISGLEEDLADSIHTATSTDFGNSPRHNSSSSVHTATTTDFGDSFRHNSVTSVHTATTSDFENTPRHNSSSTVHTATTTDFGDSFRHNTLPKISDSRSATPSLITKSTSYASSQPYSHNTKNENETAHKNNVTNNVSDFDISWNALSNPSTPNKNEKMFESVSNIKSYKNSTPSKISTNLTDAVQVNATTPRLYKMLTSLGIHVENNSSNSNKNNNERNSNLITPRLFPATAISTVYSNNSNSSSASTEPYTLTPLTPVIYEGRNSLQHDSHTHDFPHKDDVNSNQSTPRTQSTLTSHSTSERSIVNYSLPTSTLNSSTQNNHTANHSLLNKVAEKLNIAVNNTNNSGSGSEDPTPRIGISLFHNSHNLSDSGYKFSQSQTIMPNSHSFSVTSNCASETKYDGSQESKALKQRDLSIVTTEAILLVTNNALISSQHESALPSPILSNDNIHRNFILEGPSSQQLTPRTIVPPNTVENIIEVLSVASNHNENVITTISNNNNNDSSVFDGSLTVASSRSVTPRIIYNHNSRSSTPRSNHYRSKRNSLDSFDIIPSSRDVTPRLNGRLPKEDGLTQSRSGSHTRQRDDSISPISASAVLVHRHGTDNGGIEPPSSREVTPRRLQPSSRSITPGPSHRSRSPNSHNKSHSNGGSHHTNHHTYHEEHHDDLVSDSRSVTPRLRTPSVRPCSRSITPPTSVLQRSRMSNSRSATPVLVTSPRTPNHERRYSSGSSSSTALSIDMPSTGSVTPLVSPTASSLTHRRLNTPSSYLLSMLSSSSSSPAATSHQTSHLPSSGLSSSTNSEHKY